MMKILNSFLKNRPKIILSIIFLAIILVLGIPSAAGNRFVQNMIITIFLFAGLACAWNLIGGYAGQLSLGHAGFFGIGSYTVVLLNLKAGISPWLGIIVAVVFAVAASFIIGWPCFRLKGPFFCLATIAVGEVLRILAVNLTGLTYGSAGVSVEMVFGLGNMLFREKWVYGIMAFIFLAAIILVTLRIEKSKLGYYLVAIREDQDAAASLGVNATRAKLISLAISASFTSIGGVFYAQYILYIDPPSVFASNISVQMVLMTIVGGLGTVWGPVLGALLLVPMDQYIRAYFGSTIHGLNLVIYSLILVVVILVIPRGIWPTISDWIRKSEKTTAQEKIRESEGAAK